MSGLLVFFLWIVGIAAVVGLFHLLMLWMERKGWVYWTRSKGRSGSSVGNALLELHSIIEPNKKPLIEVIQEEKEEEADSGAPPEP